jgi:hypothetical protein
MTSTGIVRRRNALLMRRHTLPTKPLCVMILAAFVAGNWNANLQAGAPSFTFATDSSSIVEATPLPQSLLASVQHWASIESRPFTKPPKDAPSGQGGNHHGASVAEKLAFLYALVGGTILLVYGPQEKEGNVWTVDGKSETVAGGLALGLSVALFRDIRTKRP